MLRGILQLLTSMPRLQTQLPHKRPNLIDEIQVRIDRKTAPLSTAAPMLIILLLHNVESADSSELKETLLSISVRPKSHNCKQAPSSVLQHPIVKTAVLRQSRHP